MGVSIFRKLRVIYNGMFDSIFTCLLPRMTENSWTRKRREPVRVFNNRSSVRLRAYQPEECVVENSTLIMFVASMRETNVVRGVIEVIDGIYRRKWFLTDDEARSAWQSRREREKEKRQQGRTVSLFVEPRIDTLAFRWRWGRQSSRGYRRKIVEK